MQNPKLVVLDTMNFWISGKRKALEQVIRRCDIVILNDEEVRELSDETNLVRAARKVIRKFGVETVIVKKGEHGAVLFHNNNYFFAPAYPLEKVVDPTGAGDSFAGGFVGYLAYKDSVAEETLRKAIIYGSAIASFNVQDFSFDTLRELSLQEIDKRVKEFRSLTKF